MSYAKFIILNRLHFWHKEPHAALTPVRISHLHLFGFLDQVLALEPSLIVLDQQVAVVADCKYFFEAFNFVKLLKNHVVDALH